MRNPVRVDLNRLLNRVDRAVNRPTDRLLLLAPPLPLRSVHKPAATAHWGSPAPAASSCAFARLLLEEVGLTCLEHLFQTLLLLACLLLKRLRREQVATRVRRVALSARFRDPKRLVQSLAARRSLQRKMEVAVELIVCLLLLLQNSSALLEGGHLLRLSVQQVSD